MADEEDEPAAPEIDPDEDTIRPDTIEGYVSFIKSEFTTIRWVFAEFTTPLTRRWSYVLVAALFAVYAIGMGLPVIVGMSINKMTTKDVDGAIFLALCYLGVSVIQQGFWHLTDIAREWALGLNFCTLDQRVTEFINEKPLGLHERHGSRLNHATIDKGRWKALELQVLIAFQLVPTLLITGLSLVGIALIAPFVGLVGTVVAAIYAVWSFYLNFNVGSCMNPVEREFRRINRARVERWEKIHRVQTSGTGKRDNAKLSSRMEAMMSEDRQFWIWFSRHSNGRMLLLQRCFQTFVMIESARMLAAGRWDVGILFPLMYWAEQFAANLWMLSQIERHIGHNIVPVTLMMEALMIKPSFDIYAGAPLIKNGPLAVEFDNVSYAYTDSRGAVHTVLKDVSFKIAKGEKLAILGLSGAGKTTLMKLLLRFDDPTNGRIAINGIPLTKILHSSFMEQVGYIAQRAEVYNTTLGENLLDAVSPARREELLANDAAELWKLMRSLKVDFGAKRLTKGLDTLVGQHGLKLSGGQQQRVMIGAAAAKEPRLMVIDEATSNLDSCTEREVQEGLRPVLSMETTGLIVAHRLSTVAKVCDRFLVLRSIEEVTESGEPQIEAVASNMSELFEISPTFRKLAEAQEFTPQ